LSSVGSPASPPPPPASPPASPPMIYDFTDKGVDEVKEEPGLIRPRNEHDINPYIKNGYVDTSKCDEVNDVQIPIIPGNDVLIQFQLYTQRSLTNGNERDPVGDQLCIQLYLYSLLLCHMTIPSNSDMEVGHSINNETIIEIITTEYCNKNSANHNMWKFLAKTFSELIPSSDVQPQSVPVDMEADVVYEDPPPPPSKGSKRERERDTHLVVSDNESDDDDSWKRPRHTAKHQPIVKPPKLAQNYNRFELLRQDSEGSMGGVQGYGGAKKKTRKRRRTKKKRNKPMKISIGTPKASD
jgi:hypothetical protein